MMRCIIMYNYFSSYNAITNFCIGMLFYQTVILKNIHIDLCRVIFRKQSMLVGFVRAAVKSAIYFVCFSTPFRERLTCKNA